MNRQDFLKWASRLGELNPEQLKEVKERLVQLRTTPSVGLDEQQHVVADDWILQALAGTMRSRGFRRTSVASILYELRKHALFPLWQQHVQKFYDLVQSSCPELNKLERMALGGAVAESVGAWLDSRGIPMTMKTALRCAPELIQILDESFPGYVSSGMLAAIARGKLGDQTWR